MGLAPNAVKRKVAVAYEVAKRGFETAGRKSRLLAAFAYAASTWSQRWQVIARIEHGPKGQNPRFVVTDFEGGPERRLSLDQG